MKLLLLVVLWASLAAAYDDFHYPSEEASESEAAVPEVISEDHGIAVLRLDGETMSVVTGQLAFQNWLVLSITPTRVTIERNFARWGVVVFIAQDAAPIRLRKSVGDLSGIKQPYFNFTSADPKYFAKITSSLDDYAYQQAIKQTKFNELDFSSAASTLAPQRDYASISNNEDVSHAEQMALL